MNSLPIWTFLEGTALAHEFGHNLGLHHGVGRKAGMSEWEGGNGFLGQWGETDSEWYSTVMSWGSVRCTEPFNAHDGSECWKASSRLGRFSSATDTLSWDDEGVGEFDEVFLQNEWTLGNSEADAVSVIRRNAPYLAARGPRNRTAPPPPEFEIDDGRPDDQTETPKPPPPPPDDGPEHEAHSETVAWLNDDRHAVAVEFDEKGDDVTYRDARVLDVDLPGDQSAILYFYTPDNAEMLVKVLDGCAFNDHWWVFAASATDRPFQLTVEDVRRNTSKVYFNEGGHGAAAITDTAAFPCSLGR